MLVLLMLPADRDFRHDNMKDLRCMSFTCKGTSEILVAGCQDLMFQIDVEKGRIIEEVKLFIHQKANC